MFSKVSAGTTLDTGNPVGFFTTVADKLLRNTFSFGVNNIPVETNGVFAYSPAVQRLLQLSANLYDATTTNFYPSVFRPMFNRDNSSNVFITGYQQVVGVNGVNDPQLAPAIDVSALSTGISSNANVFGVPWIIGAKKGFPSFNKLSMETVVQITRKLEIHTPTPGSTPRVFDQTNMMWVFSISNSIAADCWNSYSTAYPNTNNFSILVQDNVSMTLETTNGVILQSLNSVLPPVPFASPLPSFTWPGSTWLMNSSAVNGLDPTAPSPFKIPLVNSIAFLPNSYYNFNPQQFVSLNDPTSLVGFQNVPVTTPLPQMVLLTTNYFQLAMLDGSNVIDYVQFSGPNRARNLNSLFQNTNTIVGYANWWGTALETRGAFNGVPAGIASQIFVSEMPYGSNGAYWGSTPQQLLTAQEEIDGFEMFLGFTPAYGQSSIVNSALAQSYLNSTMVQVPYTPSVTIVDYTSWEANDPLVHYLASDLYYSGSATSGLQPGVSQWPFNSGTLPMLPDIGQLSQRFAPWGLISPATANNPAVDQNAYNLAYKDPLIWGSDYWNFPSGNGLPLTTLGQVHRGTPWQTVFLKATNILDYVYIPFVSQVTGLATWENWTGDMDPNDAALSAPVNDWRLAGLLVALFNTNSPTQLMSVNDTSPADWSNVLNGLSVLTNSDTNVIIMSGSSPQALTIANAIAQTKATEPGQMFNSLGDILVTPELSINSPWLNVDDELSDEAYEAIPSQLLPLLRADSVGAVIQVNGGQNIQFSGSDGFAYALQTSTNLVNWEIVSTNCPMQGSFTVPIPALPSSPARFYRSVLLP